MNTIGIEFSLPKDGDTCTVHVTIAVARLPDETDDEIFRRTADLVSPYLWPLQVILRGEIKAPEGWPYAAATGVTSTTSSRMDGS